MIDSTLKNANILIVDDQAANIEILRQLLEMQGYTTIKTTTDPRLVVGMFNSSKPDLILLDLMMPHLDGFEVMEQLKPMILEGTYLPILVLTADVTLESKKRALSIGASDFLTKPFDLVEVGLRIKNLLYTSSLVQQLGNQNQILEEKVQERTSELLKTNSALLLARDKAEESDRLKTSFMNNISHEIRTPLNGILGFAPMVMDPLYSEKDKLEFLDVLQISGKRLIQTVGDYMDISLIASGNMELRYEKFAPSEMLDELEMEFRPRCEAKNLLFTLSYPETFTSIVINSDRLLVKKVLALLLDNAVKFTLKGEIRMDVVVKSNSLEFAVSDTGIGISEAALPIIFNHFTQEDTSNTRRFEGSGLGLAILKGMTELLNGEIKVESVKGKGSTFSFSIPVKMSNSNPETAEKVSVVVPNGKISKILIVEDDPFSFRFLDLSLNTSAEIIHAETGLEALELYQSNPDIALVLMDIKLPRMNGLIATQEIKKIKQDLPIIAFTSYALAGDRQKCLDAGCDDYITKPLIIEDLFRVLNKYGIYEQ